MMFLENKYHRWYIQIVERARTRTHSSGMERHHIVPKSLGGTNARSNIVSLTYREHFLSHWLLTKVTTGPALVTMHRALACMNCSRHGRMLSSWQFAIARKARHTSMLGQRYALGAVRSPETRAKMGASKRRENLSAETLAKLRVAASSRSPEAREKLRLAASNLSPETRAKRIAAAKARKGSATEATRQKIRASMLGHKRCVGRVLSEETKEKIGRASRNRSPEALAKMAQSRRDWWAKRRAAEQVSA